MIKMITIAEYLKQRDRLEGIAHHIFSLFNKEGAFDIYKGADVSFEKFDEDSPYSPWRPVEGYITLVGYYWAGDSHEPLHIIAPHDWIDNPNDEVVIAAAKDVVAKREAAKIAVKARQEAARIEKEKAQLLELQKRYPDVKPNPD
jgi:hypothetical protein